MNFSFIIPLHYFLFLALAWTLVLSKVTIDDKRNLVENCVIKAQEDYHNLKWTKNMTKQVVEVCAAQLKILARGHEDVDGAIILHLNETHLVPILGEEIKDELTPNMASWIFGSSVFIVFGFLGFVYIMKVCCASTDEINLDDMDPEALEALKAQSESRRRKGHH